MTTESDIIWESGRYSVVRHRGVYEIRVHQVTHSVTEEAYAEPSIAVARAEYLARKRG